MTNPFTVEANMARAAAGITNPTKRQVATARLERRYTKALEDLHKAETKLARAANRWDKLRKQVRRYERELDKLQMEDDGA